MFSLILPGQGIEVLEGGKLKKKLRSASFLVNFAKICKIFAKFSLAK